MTQCTVDGYVSHYSIYLNSIQPAIFRQVKHCKEVVGEQRVGK